MDTNHQSPPILKTSCPTCGTLVEAGTLKALLKLVARHCKTVKALPPIVFTPTQVFDVARAPYRWTFNRNVESQNKTTYGHWSVHAADKKHWMGYVQAQMFPWQGTLLSHSVWHLRRVYKHPQRRLDHGNVVGSYKALIDCIRDVRIIRDDDDKHFSCTYDQDPGDSTRTELSLLSWTP